MINIEDRANGDRDHDEGDLLKPLNEVKNNVLPLGMCQINVLDNNVP
jgi:hypothetical protein